MNFGDLEFDFKVSQKTIPNIVQETCEVIWNVLQPLEMPETNKEMWLKKSAEFYKFTNYPVWKVWTENTSEYSARPILDLTFSTSRSISQFFSWLWLMQTTILQL